MACILVHGSEEVHCALRPFIMAKMNSSTVMSDQALDLQGKGTAIQGQNRGGGCPTRRLMRPRRCEKNPESDGTKENKQVRYGHVQ